MSTSSPDVQRRDTNAERTSADEGEPSRAPSPSRTPRRSPRRSDDAAKQAAKEELKKLHDDMEALGKLPWCGQAEKLGATEKIILSYYEHRIVFENKMKDGNFWREPQIKYRSKYEAASKERAMSMKGLNATRLGESLLKLDSTPHEVKEAVARKMRSKLAKDYIANLETKRRAETAPESSELLVKRKASKTDGLASAKEGERQETLTKYVARDASMPSELFNLCMYYMSSFFIMCRIPFMVAESRYFLRFLKALRPTFVKQLPSQLRRLIAGSMLDELYEEAKVITTEKLSELPGRITMGIDGHKMGKRHVETLTRAKLGVSTFQHAELLATKRATGKVLCELVSKYIDGTVIAVVADNTGNNTGNRTGLFALLRARTPTLLCIGCCVHVLDLVIEDVAKMEYVSAAANMAHFVTTFVKKHALVYEEFLQCQKLLKVKLELVVFPLTRFAYAHLMCMRVVKNFSVLRLLSEASSL